MIVGHNVLCEGVHELSVDVEVVDVLGVDGPAQALVGQHGLGLAAGPIEIVLHINLMTIYRYMLDLLYYSTCTRSMITDMTQNAGESI